MTLIQSWVLALFLVLSSLSPSKAQTLDYVTGNLINFSGSPTSTTSNWNNGIYVNQLGCFGGNTPGNCGPYPSIRTDGNINFSYGQVNLNEVINVANAVAGATGPVNVTGFNFSFRAKNGNGWDDGRVDQLNAYVQLYSPTRALLENYNYDLNRKFDWTNFTFNTTFTTPHPLSSVGTAQVGFIGKDNNYWAGPYGPEIQNVSFSLKYSVNPCATNPGYMPTCPGFNNVITSSNLVPNPGAQASWGNGINNSFAIQTALQNSGSGLIVHGFDYGYQVNATQSYCEAEFIICWSWHSGGSVQVNAGITNAKGQNIYAVTRNYNESGYANENFHYRFASSTNQMLLGNFNFTASTGGDAWVGNMYSRMVYSQDPCVNNPNYSASCINKVQPTYTAPTVVSTTTSKELQSLGNTSQNVGGVQMSTTGTLSVPDNIPQTVKDTQASAQQTMQVVSAPTPQQQVGKNTVANVVSQALANEKALQATAVQNASRFATASIAKAQEQAAAVVTNLNSMSAASSLSSQETTIQQGQTTAIQNTTVSQQAPPVPPTPNAIPVPRTSNESLNTQVVTSSTQTVAAVQTTSEQAVQQTYQPQTATVFESAPTQLATTQQSINNNSQFSLYVAPVKMYVSPTTETQQSQSTYTLLPPTTVEPPQQVARVESKFSEPDVPTMFVNSLPKNNTLTEISETRANIDSAQREQSTETVKKDVQTNELAGGVDIASIATQPRGYDLYSQLTLKDAAFYKVEDIYKNQRTIDNVRLIRGLQGGSDRLHQQMVDQQYQLGK